MSKRGKRVFRTLVWVTIGILMTAWGVRTAYNQRGYLAYGGEWLILPLIMMLRYDAYEICEQIREVANDED